MTVHLESRSTNLAKSLESKYKTILRAHSSIAAGHLFYLSGLPPHYTYAVALNNLGEALGRIEGDGIFFRLWSARNDSEVSVREISSLLAQKESAHWEAA